jgi:hypothetical protein
MWWQAPEQASRDGRVVHGSPARAASISLAENPIPCPGADGAICALVADVGDVDSLAEAIASIIRSLPFTGFALLPWLAASVMLTIAGALLLTESRRRPSFQTFG